MTHFAKLSFCSGGSIFRNFQKFWLKLFGICIIFNRENSLPSGPSGMRKDSTFFANTQLFRTPIIVNLNWAAHSSLHTLLAYSSNFLRPCDRLKCSLEK